MREFLGKEAKNVAREAEETEEGYSINLWRKMAELGWMGVSFPEEYGGNGGSFIDLILILEEMGRVLMPGPFIPTLVSGHAILEYGNEAQKKEFLPKLTNGKLIITPTNIEPPYPPPQGTVKDQLKLKNENYILSGTRLFVSFAHVADWFIYGAKAERGKTLFLVNAKDGGVNCRLLKNIASDQQYEVVLERIKVPNINILGEISKGEEISNEMNEYGALFQSAFILGMLGEVLRISVEYAKKREQFGRLIGSFQAIQHQCADMATDIDQVKFLTYQAAWRLSEKRRATKEISMAKARASDASRRVCLLGIKIHGGIGIILDYDMQLFFRKAKVAELAFGDADFHREIVYQELGF